MTISVQGPDGVVNQFPDGMADADIEKAMAQHYAPPTAQPQAQPDLLDRTRQSLKDAYQAPDAGFATKAASTLGLVPIDLMRGLRDSIPAALTAPARSFTDPNFDPIPEAANLAGLITSTIRVGGSPLLREAAGSAGTALREASPLTMVAKEAPAPTRQAIKNQSTQAYKAATDAGIVVTPEAFQNFASDTTAALKEKGLNDRLHPNVAAALDDIKAAAASGQPQTLQDIETLRRVSTSAVQGAVNNDQASKAGALVRSIDGFINNLEPDHLVAGDAAAGVPALNDARALWTKNAKLGDIEDIADTASRQDDPNKYIKQQFTRITKDSDSFNRYTPDEQSLILDIAKTGKMEALGKLAPSLDLAGIAKIGAYVGGAAISPLTLGLPAIGFGAKALAQRGRQASLSALEDTIARGGPAQSFMDRFQFKPPPPTPENFPLLPPPSLYGSADGRVMNGSQATRFMPDEMQAGAQPGTSATLPPDSSPSPQLMLPPPRFAVTREGQAMSPGQAMQYMPDERQAGMQPGTSRAFPDPQAPPPQLQLPPPRMFSTPQGQAMNARQAMQYVPDERQAGVQPGTSRLLSAEPSPSEAPLLLQQKSRTLLEGAGPSNNREAAFVSAPDGSPDFGGISSEAVKASNGVLKPLPIRLSVGNNRYGLEHISPSRAETMNAMGFPDAESFVDYVSKNHNMIVQQSNGRIGLIVAPGQGKLRSGAPANNYMAMELRPEGDHYSVTTIIPDAADRYLKSGGKLLLWRRGPNPAN